MSDRPWNEFNTLIRERIDPSYEETRDGILSDLVHAIDMIHRKYRKSEFDVGEIIDSCIEEASIKAADMN